MKGPNILKSLLEDKRSYFLKVFRYQEGQIKAFWIFQKHLGTQYLKFQWHWNGVGFLQC